MIDIWTIVLAIGVTIFLLFGLTVFRGAPYVPSLRRYVARAFHDLYTLSEKDVLVDFGSGDGKVLRMAAQTGARAVGFELNPILVLISRVLAKGNPRIQTQLADMWLTPIPNDTTLVYLFAVSRDRKRITKRLQQETNRLARPIRVMVLGGSLEAMTPDAELDAYKLYTLQPQSTNV